MAGLEEEYRQHLRAVELLEQCGIPRLDLVDEKAKDYRGLAELNLSIKEQRNILAMCKDIKNVHKHIMVPAIQTTSSKTIVNMV